MRRISREQLQQEARIYARRRVERLTVLNNRAVSGRRPFREPQDLAGAYERLYTRLMARRSLITP